MRRWPMRSQALREFEGDPDTITEIYLLGAEDKLAGVVTLPRLVLSTRRRCWRAERGA